MADNQDLFPENLDYLISSIGKDIETDVSVRGPSAVEAIVDLLNEIDLKTAGGLIWERHRTLLRHALTAINSYFTGDTNYVRNDAEVFADFLRLEFDYLRNQFEFKIGG